MSQQIFSARSQYFPFHVGGDQESGKGFRNDGWFLERNQSALAYLKMPVTLVTNHKKPEQSMTITLLVLCLFVTVRSMFDPIFSLPSTALVKTSQTKGTYREMSGCTKNCLLAKKLLDKNALNCSSCQSLLKIPVFLVSGVGNVCEKCTQKNNWTGAHQEIFDLILTDLVIPCSIEDCKTEIPYEKFEDHLASCKYRLVTIKCLRQQCNWKGKLDEFEDHFTASHAADVVSADELIPFELNGQPTQTKLLLKGPLNFILVFEQDSGVGSFSMFKLTGDGPGPVETTITFCGKNRDKYFSKKTMKINPMHLLTDNVHSAETSVATIEPEVVKSLSLDDKGLFSIGVNLPPGKNLLQILECPICNETMKSPIYQWATGHTICHHCIQKLVNCPTCRADVTKSIRNYFLENLTSEVLYSCTNKALGCRAVLSGDVVVDHELMCSYRADYTCPFDGCSFECSPHNISGHLGARHQNVSDKHQFQVSGWGQSDLSRSVLLHCHGCFFSMDYYYSSITKKARIELKYLRYDQKVENLFCEISVKSRSTGAEVRYIKSISKPIPRPAQDITGDYVVFVFPLYAFGELANFPNDNHYDLNYQFQLLLK